MEDVSERLIQDSPRVVEGATRVDGAWQRGPSCAAKTVTDDAPTPLGGRDLRGWRQVRCGACGLPTRLCVCAHLPTIETRARVVVVMHHIEAVRSTNTGRLVAAMLPRATLRLRGVREAADAPTPEGRRLVLFPADDARPLTARDAGDDAVLVVPDGTWAQARRIHRRDPFAQGAEAVTLPVVGVSEYGLRRNAREGGLCTLEAVAVAMGVLEGPDVEASMRAAFTLWRARAASVRAGH